jgi:hypothetical protein
MSCVSHSSYPSLLVVKSCLSILSGKYPNNLLGFLLPKNHAQVGLLQTLGTNRPTKSATKLLMLNTWTLRFLIAGFTTETDILDYLYCSFQQIPVWNHPSVYTLLQNAVDIPITSFPIFCWFNTPIFFWSASWAKPKWFVRFVQRLPRREALPRHEARVVMVLWSRPPMTKPDFSSAFGMFWV